MGLELSRRLAARNRGNDYGAPLVRIASEIQEDRESLLSIMRALEVGADRAKVALAWCAEKAGRLKLNGRLLSYSPLSRLMELELLMLGVTGKLALWRALRQLAEEESRLERPELERLIERALGQQGEIESLRLRAAAEALTG